MTRSPFVAVLVSTSLALQLLLAGSGATCIATNHASAAPGTAASSSMAGMDVSMNMDANAGAHDPGGRSDGAPESHEAPCEQPATPADCQVMAPCAGGFFASTVADLGASDRVPSRVVALRALALSSRTVPPELPPPRA